MATGEERLIGRYVEYVTKARDEMDEELWNVKPGGRDMREMKQGGA